MALIEISECFLGDYESMLAIIDHFDRFKELRCLRNPYHKTRTFYVESIHHKPSEIICPSLTRNEKGDIIIIPT